MNYEQDARRHLIEKLQQVHDDGYMAGMGLMGSSSSGGYSGGYSGGMRSGGMTSGGRRKRPMMRKRHRGGVLLDDFGGVLLDEFGGALVESYGGRRRATKRKVSRGRGTGGRGRTSDWIKRVKAYSHQHGISYKDALMALRGT